MNSLKILTIDGGGLQALTTLSILNDVCEEIGKSSGTDTVPAPYELFDIIGGIGTGGWLALLLGRFRLSILTCMSIYMEIANAIDPQSALQSTRRKSSSGFRLDQKKLMAKIDQVLARYGLDDKTMLDHGSKTNPAENVRCKYAFAAGVINNHAPRDEREYELFRTYVSKPRSAEVRKYSRAGPDPASCKISEACAATGAAQYFLKPCKIGGTSYFDANFPHPHKVSSLALDEAYSIFGEKAALSLILNVGPSIASDTDINQLKECSTTRISRLARIFSWPKSSDISQPRNGLTSDKMKEFSVSAAPARSETSSSLAASDTERKLQLGIRERLKEDYPPHGDRLYHHIGPVEKVAQNSVALNDVSAMDLSNEEVDKFRASDDSKELIKEAARQYVWVEASVA